MPDIESPRLGILQPLNPFHQVGFGRFNKQVVMIAHQHPGVKSPTRPSTYLRDRLQEKPAVIVIEKNRPPAIAPRHNVIECSRVFDSQTPRHSPNSTEVTVDVNWFLHTDPQFLTPSSLFRYYDVYFIISVPNRI